jgi:hypothetical protein
MTDRLELELRVREPDDLYQALVDAHRDLSADASRLFDAKLILLLANQLGDVAVVKQAIAKAREGIA